MGVSSMAALINRTYYATKATNATISSMSSVGESLPLTDGATKYGKTDATMDLLHATKHCLKLNCLMSLAIKASEDPYATLRLFHEHF